MGRFKGIILGVCILFIHCSVYADYVINSSVSPEFPNGLHSKYLRYLADKLNKELVITPMPFARRLKSLKHGDIDIMVGLQQDHNTAEGFIYLEPSYESLTHTIFVQAGDEGLFKTLGDLQQHRIATTIDANYFDDFNDNQNPFNIEVSSLKQKIALLQKGRVKGFIHFRESAFPLLAEMGLKDQVVMADYQPKQAKKYYVALSLASHLYREKSTIENIVRQGALDGDFQLIRHKHYNPPDKQNQ